MLSVVKDSLTKFESPDATVAEDAIVMIVAAFASVEEATKRAAISVSFFIIYYALS